MTEQLHPQTLTLKLADGKDYSFKPLTYSDWDDLSTALQFSGYNRIKDQPWASKAELKEALTIAMSMRPTQEQLEQYLSSSEGLTEILYLSLRKNHPQMKRKDVAGLFTMKDQDMLLTISEFIQKTSLPDPEEAESPNEPGVKAER